MKKSDLIKAAFFGPIVGDALGVPVEFKSREELKKDKVTTMREFGTHMQQKGTWSDDTSMALAFIDSVVARHAFDPEDIMCNFYNWLTKKLYTPYGEVFDVGITCKNAIFAYNSGLPAIKCGRRNETDNGNGSLMRIMPASLIFALQSDGILTAENVNFIHETSMLTHAHPRSLIGCMFYTLLCDEIINNRNDDKLFMLQNAATKTFHFYENDAKNCFWYNELFEEEIKKDVYKRLKNAIKFKNLPEEKIKSTGYIVDSLEAAIWCFLNTESYEECILKAVNLGDDTDTIASIAGGIAAIFYGYDNIPKKWIDKLARESYLESVCEDFIICLKTDKII